MQKPTKRDEIQKRRSGFVSLNCPNFEAPMSLEILEYPLRYVLETPKIRVNRYNFGHALYPDRP